MTTLLQGWCGRQGGWHSTAPPTSMLPRSWTMCMSMLRLCWPVPPVSWPLSALRSSPSPGGMRSE
eukprot:10112475-Prorocentrum_lima.AAC.1